MNWCRHWLVLCSITLWWSACTGARGEVGITEFMAANVELPDKDGEFADWLELYNDSEEAVELGGWFLTDDPDKLTKFTLPRLTIAPGAYRVVFASGKEGNHPFEEEIHTNFSLRLSGEYLALVRPDGSVAHAYEPYPKQRPGVSYGMHRDDEARIAEGFLRRATPGGANAPLWLGEVADTEFSVDRGVYQQAFDLRITCETEGATILYTLDGREPSGGSIFTGPIGTVLEPEEVIRIGETTTLRAIAMKDGYLSTNVDTQTYLFPSNVVRQPDEPEGFPTTWQGADYGMDQDEAHLPAIAGDESLSPEDAKAVIADSLRELPSLSIVLPTDDLFGRTNGIYHHTERRGMDSEREASVELIHPDGKRGFQLDAGLRIQGFTSRNASRNPKHSLRLLFKERYGKSKLAYPLFGDEAAQSFDTLVLRSNAQDAWVYDSVGNRVGQFVRDEWNRRLQRAMGWPACHGTWVHLYLNGLYWGVYNPTERPDDDFMANYYGGDPEDWDVVKNHEEIIRGDARAYDALLGLVQNDAKRFSAGYRDFSSNDAYLAVQEHVDVPSMIDYMIHNMYSAAQDWPGNFYMARDRSGASGGFKFISWDNEHGMKSDVNENRTTPHRRDEDSPTKFHHPLRDNAEYRLLFADHLHRAFFNEGPLAVNARSPSWDPAHPERNRPAALWMEITREIEQALVAESARWGDYRRTMPYTVAVDFTTLREQLLEDWFPRRSEIVLDQFRDLELYPDLEAPIIGQPGGTLSSETKLSMRSRHMVGPFTPNGGKVYYTKDGSDPRLFGGEIAPTAVLYETPFLLAESATIKARLLRGEEWSALNEVRYWVDQEPASSENLLLTAIHYEPAPPSESEQAAGHPKASAFEFVELMNGGVLPIDLTGARFTAGIRFAFDGEVLDPGERLWVVNDLAAFQYRYGDGWRVAGSYVDSRLDNDGERLRLADRRGGTIFEVFYRPAAPWPTLNVGQDQLLRLREPKVGDDFNDSARWNATPALDAPKDLLEQALGLDPSSVAWGRVERTENALALVYQARRDTAFTITIERSADLSVWEELSTEALEIEVLTDSLERRKLRLSSPGNERFFYRLSVSR